MEPDAFDYVAMMNTEERADYERWLAADAQRWLDDPEAQAAYERWMEEDAAERSGVVFEDDMPW